MLFDIVEELIEFYPELSEKKFVVEKYVKMAINNVKSFCNRDDVPEALQDVVFSIVENTLKANSYIKVEKEVSQVSRGDTSISYVKSTDTNGANFLKNYENQLVKFKKLKIPQ